MVTYPGGACPHLWHPDNGQSSFPPDCSETREGQLVMRKRLILIISIFILIAVFAAACNSQLKMVSRDDYGTATLTPFLHKATYTSESPPMEMAGKGEANSPTPTGTIESSISSGSGEVQSTEMPSLTPSSTSTPQTGLPNPTATLVPTKPPADTSTPKSPADTSTPKPPADTSTPKPPADTSTPVPPADTSTPVPPSATSPPGECVFSGNSSYESQVITLINQERTDRGLSALVQNSSLTLAARRHSEDMACNDNWSHTGSDGSTLSTRILAAGYTYSWAAENIAASSSQYFSPSSVVSMWMNSDGHRANILSPNAVHIGVGFRYAGDVNLLPYDAYYTADFGRP